jgi:hypothetical protein
MYAIITIFYVSLLGMAAMILLKRAEVRSGHPTAVSTLGRKADRIFDSIWSAVSRFVGSFNRRTMIVIAQLIAFHILLRVRKVYVELKHRTLMNPHGKKVIDAVRGRGEVRNHGASFYLRRISEK